MKALGLTDEEIDTASAEELRIAYRELLADAQNLRALISERTTEAVEDLRDQGLPYNGNLPYGLEVDEKTGKIAPSRYEQRLIAEVKRLREAGHSLRDIARTLTERNFFNRKGRPLAAKQIARILAAPEVTVPTEHEQGDGAPVSRAPRDRTPGAES